MSTLTNAVRRRGRGFTLIELLTALIILSILGLMSYRGLSAVLDTREHVAQETAKWRTLAGFFARFERDVQRAAPRPVRGASPEMPAFRGGASEAGSALIELTRFGAADDSEPPRRIAYAMNAQHEIELWLWPALDMPPDSEPQRYPVLSGVRQLEVDFLTPGLAWLDAWPSARDARVLPVALRVRLVLLSGEEIVRFFPVT